MTRLHPLVAFVVLTGCTGAESFLDGSIKQSHDLSFDRVELRYFTDQAAYELAYQRTLAEGGTASDTVAKLVFNEPAGGIVPRQEIDLLAPEIDGVVERITAAGDPFPSELETATVTFTSTAVVGEAAQGEHAVVFANGKTLYGAFRTELTAVSF